MATLYVGTLTCINQYSIMTPNLAGSMIYLGALINNKGREPYPKDCCGLSGNSCFDVCFPPSTGDVVRWLWEILSFSNLGQRGRDNGYRELGWHSDPIFGGSFANHWQDNGTVLPQVSQAQYQQTQYCPIQGYCYLKIQLILHCGSLILKYHYAASHWYIFQVGRGKQSTDTWEILACLSLASV